jgi:hypothetical protein
LSDAIWIRFKIAAKNMLPNFGCNTFGLKDRQGGKSGFLAGLPFYQRSHLPNYSGIQNGWGNLAGEDFGKLVWADDDG